MRDATLKLQEAKGLVKEFEKAANFQGRPPHSVAARKKELVGQLNGYVVRTRGAKQMLKDKQELLGAAGGGRAAGAAAGSSWMGSLGWGGGGGQPTDAPVNLNDRDAVRGASNQQVMAAGRYQWEQDEQVRRPGRGRGGRAGPGGGGAPREGQTRRAMPVPCRGWGGWSGWSRTRGRWGSRRSTRCRGRRGSWRGW